MKHIVLPVNFSDELRNSLIAFIKQMLKKTKNVQFTLLHAYDTTGYGSAMMHDMSERLEKNAKEDLLQEKKKIEAEIPNVQLNTFVGRGLLTSVVNNYEKETSVDFMVVPLKGSNMLQSILLSGKPSDLAEQSNVPMLFLPNTDEVELPTKIAFGIDVKPFQNEEDFKGILTICQVLGAKLHFVYVKEDDLPKKNDFDANYAKYLTDFEYDYTEIAQDNAPKGLWNFVQKENLNGIALIERKSTFLQRLFKASVLDEMLELAKLPIIVINELRATK
ncbi:MAG: universal stress protein [Flavobacteriaceae bacterium]|nr:universal stress protein [Flavobacteriaceae bacterium]